MILRNYKTVDYHFINVRRTTDGTTKFYEKFKVIILTNVVYGLG